MNTRRNEAQRLEEEISNAGVPPRGDQVPPLEEDANRPPLMNEAIRADIIQYPKPFLPKYKPPLLKTNP